MLALLLRPSQLAGCSRDRHAEKELTPGNALVGYRVRALPTGFDLWYTLETDAPFDVMLYTFVNRGYLVKSLVWLLATLTGMAFLALDDAVPADWPTWRHDVTRSGVSPSELPGTLYLRWSRGLPRPVMAWPNEPRLQFDGANEPIVMGKTLFLGSSYDGSLRAFATESGELRWTFYTEGPIRCAPVAWKERVYVGSDDGYLYCLTAATGEMLWRVRGAPDDRPDYRQLGNARLVSYWPVRGGAVLHDGTIYFGAGIWPSMGVFINAVDAETGHIQWSNHEANYIKQVRLDHNDMQEAGLSPQGYFLFVDGKLHVPNGRSMPAGFDPETGKLLQYVQGYRRGDSRVTASGNLLFVGDGGIVDADDGREVGERWVSAGKDAPAAWSTPKLDLFEGPMFGYKFVPGCNFRSVFDRGVAYGVDKGFLVAHDLNKATTSLYEKKKGKFTYHPTKWTAPELWRRYWIAQKPGATVGNMVKAGSRLYVAIAQQIVVVDVAAKPRIAGKLELNGSAASLIAADGKLFVSMTDGRMLCFGKNPSSINGYPLPNRPLKHQDDSLSRQVRQILQQSTVTEGYVVVLGVPDKRVITELLAQSKLHVIAVDQDRSKVNAFRQQLVDARLYGTRAEVFVGDPLTFRFPSYLASLLIAPRELEESLFLPDVLARCFETLRPYGGLLWIQGHGIGLGKLKETAASAKLVSADITGEDDAILVRRVGALPGSVDWTHEGSSAARTYYSGDDLVRAPLGVLWYGDGPDYGFYKKKDYGRGVKPQVAGGRVFSFDDIRQLIGAVDAYTGRLLWTFNTGTDHVRLVSRTDGVYVARKRQCDLLDPTTGAIRKTYPCHVRKEAGKRWEVVDIRVADQVILVALGYDVPDGHSHQAVSSGLWDCEALVALDRETGKQLWVRYPARRYNIHAIAMGHGMVFVTDSIAPLEASELSRRGELPKTVPSISYALDAETGVEKWTYQAEYDCRTIARSWQSIRANDDWISYSQEKGLVLLGKLAQVTAIDAESGITRWSNRAGSQPIVLRDDSFINQGGGRYDLETGKQTSKATFFRRSGGCNYAVGNKHLMFIRNRSVTYFDIRDHKEYSLRDIRSGCSNSFVAADGLLNMPCYSYGCVCNYPLQTSFAMRYMPEAAGWAGDKPFELQARK